MKKTFVKIITMLLVVMLSVGLFVACDPDGETEKPWATDLAGVTDTEIWVGNTAATTGAMAEIGVPFNLGIEAAFAKYNAAGGFDGKQVKLKHYDDQGDATKSASLMEQLVFEDEIFAVVGNYGAYAVNVNLDILKEEKVPMVYAAAGNASLYNANATSDGDRCIFPVQPLNVTEGQNLIARAFAVAALPDAESATGFTLTGGLGATKVGVIANSNEASQSMLQGIKDGAALLPESKKNAIIYQDVAGTDFSAAANALVAQGCDVVIVTTIAADYIQALTSLLNAGYNKAVLTSYNNASAAYFNDATSGKITESGAALIGGMTVYSQGWLDITSLTYVYNADTTLLNTYKSFGLATEAGMAGFNEVYWGVAEQIFNYALSAGNDLVTAFGMSYNSYALAGYIAGDLFCQALAEVKAQGLELTRENFVNVMESKVWNIAMGDTISYANGARKGVESFSASYFFNYNSVATALPYAGLTSTEYLKSLIAA